MIILSKYNMDQISEQHYYIRCKEHILCPCCGGQIKVIGSRIRKYINNAGEKVHLVIRRLRCRNCKRVHHELPDILVPYKRYESSSIENVLVSSSNSTVTAEESTIYRWKIWFNHLIIKVMAYLFSAKTRVTFKGPNNYIINYCLKKHPKWLAKIIRKLVFLNYW